MELWSWYWKYNPLLSLAPLYFWETKRRQNKEIILIRIFKSFITSFLLLGKKGLMLLLINLQSCVQLSIHSLRKGLTVHWFFKRNIWWQFFFFCYFTVNSFFCCLEMAFSGKTMKIVANLSWTSLNQSIEQTISVTFSAGENIY